MYLLKYVFLQQKSGDTKKTLTKAEICSRPDERIEQQTRKRNDPLLLYFEKKQSQTKRNIFFYFEGGGYTTPVIKHCFDRIHQGFVINNGHY